MNLPSNLFDGDVKAQVFLCQPDKKIIGEILPYEFNGNFKFNTYSEISFTIDKYYNDLFEGTTKINPYYDLLESLRVIYIRGIGHFVIQDVKENEGDTYNKSITCFSLEYNTGQKYLESFYVNTGEDNSIEVMYYAQQYGVGYTPEAGYDAVNTSTAIFDPYQRYYIKVSNEKGTSWNAEEKQVLDTNHFKTFIGDNSETTLYIQKYPNVRFYWPTQPELSLLHHVFDRIPEWKIGHVDRELWYQERTFSEDRTAVYDFLYNTAAETIKFVMEWDSINGVCNFYQTKEDGITTNTYVRTNVYNPNFVYYSDDNGTIAEEQPTNESDVINGTYYINVGNDIETQWDTDVFISRENLASELSIQYSTDDIKTKLKITGSDDLDVRDVNLGQNYILNLSYYNTPLWLGEDLHLKYNAYTNDLVKYTQQYKKLVSARSAAYNEYSDLVNYVPIEPRVMLVGDEFEKLYCIYTKYRRTVEYKSDNIYFTYDKGKYSMADPLPNRDDVENDKNYYYIENLNAQLLNLQTKLNTYKVDQKDGKRAPSSQNDDVLLTLTNDSSDSVTIGVRYQASYTQDTLDASKYCVYRTLTRAATGISNTIEYPLEAWISGELTAKELGLEDEGIVHPFKIKSIGTLGAYFCLVRDETNPAELEDYGIRLLEEKQATYTKIFITQTEGYMNKEDSQCVTSKEMPIGNEYPIGTKWLDTNNTNDGKLIIKHRTDNGWEPYTPDGNDYENYARFYENYVKLGNVQSILAEKQRIADYLLNGVAVDVSYATKADINLYNLLRAAILHFIAPGNDIYITKLGEEKPNGSIKEGSVWFHVINDGYSFYTQIQQYQDGQWQDYVTNIKPITLTSYDEDSNYITFHTGFTLANGVYKDGVTYYSDENGTVANPQPSVIQNEINSIAKEYNTLVNGNVDYSKRPFISGEKMREYYQEFVGEIATTYDQDIDAKDLMGVTVYTIKVTPILNNGNILTRQEFYTYMLHLRQMVYEGSTIKDILDWDRENNNLVINIVDGQTIYNEEGMSELDVQLDEIKQRHWNLVKSFREKEYYTNEEYVVYVSNGTPYVAYARSQGLCLTKMNKIKEAIDMNTYFDEYELVRLSPFIREDEYNDSNFLLTTYESEEEEMSIKQELLNAGEEELKKICQPKLSFNASIANILAIPEFAPIKNQFKLGNFVKVGIREDYVKRVRLLEVNINFDDPSDFNCTFGDLITTKSEVDKHAELLSMAVTAGKSVASNQSKWQKGADKATALDQAINDGLRDAALSIGATEGQSISWDSYGIWGRKLIDGTTDQYEPEQFRLSNNKLVFSSDGFKTSKAVFGKYTINGEDRWGPLAEYITADMIEGKSIKGGSIQIGDENEPGGNVFIVHTNGSVEIKSNGTEKYASVSAIEDIKNVTKYRTELSYTGNTIFNTTGQTCTVTCKVYDDKGEVVLPSDTVFKWYLNGEELPNKTTSEITITANEVVGSAQLNCQVIFNNT